VVPAPGQGSLALQVRSADAATIEAVGSVADLTAMRELTAERAAVAPLGASCATPIGVHASTAGARLTIEAFVGLPDGSEWLRDRVEGEAESPTALGFELAERLLLGGARELLERAEILGGGA
jgi:hydroxymethylbilane synthase